MSRYVQQMPILVYFISCCSSHTEVMDVEAVSALKAEINYASSCNESAYDTGSLHGISMLNYIFHYICPADDSEEEEKATYHKPDFGTEIVLFHILNHSLVHYQM